VLRLLREVELDMSTAGTASLRVRSSPAGCPLFINGRRLGVTPFVLRQLPPGEYRVQAECDPAAPARVHRVVLAAEPTTVRVHARFDAAVRTEGALRLAYADAAAADAHRFADALRVARATRASTVLVLTPGEGGALRLDRIDVAEQRVVASALVEGDALQRRAARAVALLWKGRSADLTGARPEPMDPWVPAPSREAFAATEPASERLRGPGAPVSTPSSARATRRSPAGVLLVSAGAAALAAGWGTYALALQRGRTFGETSPFDADFLERQARYDRARHGAAGLFVAGSALSTLAVPLLAPPSRERALPWWGWAAGGAGLALAGAGAVRMALRGGLLLDGHALDEGATRREPTRLLGAAMLLHAAPLLAVPVSHLVRAATGGAAEVAVDVGPGTARAWVGGTF
jgi:hypothetical protein